MRNTTARGATSIALCAAAATHGPLRIPTVRRLHKSSSTCVLRPQQWTHQTLRASSPVAAQHTAADKGPDDEALLSWSLVEQEEPEHGSHAPAVQRPRAGSRSQQRQQSRRQQQGQQLGLQQGQKQQKAKGNQQRQQQGGDTSPAAVAVEGVDPRPPPAARLAADALSKQRNRQQPRQGQSSIRDTSSRRGQHRAGSQTQAADPPDPYREAQQRVRAVLAAADPSDPAAAAEVLPDTVNDLTIALHLLATAPRPKVLAAYRHYEVAVQTLAAAVVQKYKRLLLKLLPSPPGSGHQQRQLAAALATLPATKLAAITFSLGVLGVYDSPLVQALEAASLQLIYKGAFKPNQLGQLVQGFVYLDHTLSPEWHAAFRDVTRSHLSGMQATQLASLAVWLTTYCLHSSGTTSAAAAAAVAADSAAAPLVKSVADSLSSAAPSTAAAITTGTHVAVQPGPGWVAAYLTAVGRNAASLKPLQLVQVLQAGAVLYHCRQQQQQQRGVAQPSNSDQGLSVFHGIPVDLQAVSTAGLQSAAAASPWHGPAAVGHRGMQHGKQHNGRAQHHSDIRDSRGSMISGGSSWVLPLVAAVQQQLPQLTMAHLAAALPWLLVLTRCPWPQELLQPLLLQVKLQLPSSAGRDLVAVAQAVAHLAGPDVLAADAEWCDDVVAQLHAQLLTLGPAELAGAVHVVALLRVRPYKAWVYAFCQRLRVDTKAMDSREIIMVLEGLAGIGVQLDPEVLHVFVLGIKRWMGALSYVEVGRVITALRCMYPKVLPGRTVQKLVEELQRRQQFLQLQVQQQQAMLP